MSKKKRQKKYRPKTNTTKPKPLLNKVIDKNSDSDNDDGWKLEYKAVLDLHQQKDVKHALTRAEALLQQYPNIEYVLNLTAVLFAQNHRHQDAIATWQRITNHDKKVGVLSNIGRTYQLIGNLDKADRYLQKALTLDAEHLDALLNMGVVQQRKEQYSKAITYYEKVLALQPQHLQALFNLATVYQHQLDFQTAYQLYEQVLKINPTYIDAQANLVFTQHYVIPYEPTLIAQRAMTLGKLYAQQKPIQTTIAKAKDADKPLHIGLVSADLRNHPVGYFIEGLLTSEQIKQFTWSAYANTPIVNELSERIRPIFTHWHHIDTWSDERVVEQIRQDNIDILIDLSGLTAGNRMGVFAAQAAPLQLSWLGYFGTTGLPMMQAVIADPYCVPTSEEKWFSERVWRLPHTRLCFSEPDSDISPNELPALKNGYFTFGCFQNLSKINDAVLAVWATIAKQVPTAHWRFQNSRLGQDSQDLPRFKQKLLDWGFVEDNLYFYGATPRLDYFQAHQHIDIILDTFPYPGGTTTTEALWMGVPTITFAQAGMLARQGEQLLSAAGLSDWVCHNKDDYVTLATNWADSTHWQTLGKLRKDLRNQVTRSPLFDNERFANDWCLLIRQIWRDACQ